LNLVHPISRLQDSKMVKSIKTLNKECQWFKKDQLRDL
jgi:hypothetical protein